MCEKIARSFVLDQCRVDRRFGAAALIVVALLSATPQRLETRTQ
jgi:hypothetical protein